MIERESEPWSRGVNLHTTSSADYVRVRSRCVAYHAKTKAIAAIWE